MIVPRHVFTPLRILPSEKWMEVALPAISAEDAAMSRVAAGDTVALAWLFDTHKARLFGFLFHLVGDRSLAEDLLGETFLRLYETRSRYRAGSGFTPWLFTLARNLAIRELRRNGVQLRAQSRLQREAATQPDGWDPEREEARRQVQAALLTLPEEQRSAVVLKEYAGLNYREIAQVLRCSEEAARARTYRARGALREALRDWWEG
jgi:RNA polymerase sigma-70 factor (ECF subfamily)